MRKNKVSVFFSNDELSLLDFRRGNMPRAACLRHAALNTLPPIIPTLNRDAWAALARSASNLNQIAKRLNAGDAPLDEIRNTLAEFRSVLIGATMDGDKE